VSETCALCLRHVQLAPDTRAKSDIQERTDMISADCWHVADHFLLRSIVSLHIWARRRR
jgi:hypothetical protein